MPIINISFINIINLFSASILNIMFYAIIIKKTFKINVQKDKKKILFALIFIGITTTIINIFNKNAFKMLMTFPLIVYTISILFGRNYQKSISYTLFATFYAFIGEILVSLIFTFSFLDYSFIYKNIFGTVIGCLITIMMTYPLIFVKPLSKTILFIISKIEKKKNIQILLLLITFSSIIYKIVVSTSELMTSLTNIIIVTIISVIVYQFCEQYKKLNNLSNDYNNLINYLEKYEKEIIEKRKIIHDYNNQLIIINGYADKNKKLKEYVTELIKEQRNIQDNLIIKNIDKIPNGLKGLIYYKFSQIDSKINIDINVANNLNKFTKLSSKTNKDVLKIIGILLDNAIEAVQIEKEKNISLYLETKNNIIKIILKNSCSNNISKLEIMNIGFSTKGKHRGYGLSIIKDILEHEKNIKLDIIQEKKEFIAKLEIAIF